MTIADLLQWAEHSQLILFGINLFLSIFVLITIIKVSKQLKKSKIFLKENENKDIEQMLINMAEKLNTNSLKVDQITTDFGEFKEISKFNLQKWGLVRFKAFNNIGGDQSFALALLDSFGNGLVLSSIFGREESVVYCKPIKTGVSVYPLSKEEQDAINQALKINQNKA